MATRSLSPDGRHLIYFARGGRRHAETKGTWTAISRAPWLKAIVLYGKGDCWQGGGLFTAPGRYWLNGCHFPVRDNGELEPDTVHTPPGGYGAECEGIYFPRLLRDGWSLRERLTAGATSRLTIFEKPLPHGWILRKYAHADAGPREPGHGCYWDEHELESPGGDLRLDRKQWEWAERDGDSVVWAVDGCLYRAPITPDGPSAGRVLRNFNDMVFEAIEAPYE